MITTCPVYSRARSWPDLLLGTLVALSCKRVLKRDVGGMKAIESCGMRAGPWVHMAVLVSHSPGCIEPIALNSCLSSKLRMPVWGPANVVWVSRASPALGSATAPRRQAFRNKDWLVCSLMSKARRDGGDWCVCPCVHALTTHLPLVYTSPFTILV